MAKLNEGDRVRVVTREVTAQDKAINSFYEHMQGLTGVVENYYGPGEVAVKVDLDSLGKIPSDVHRVATDRMRTKFVDSVGEEARKQLTKAEMEFVPHYMIIVQESDLQKI